jgi:Alr-MurF fusion protein
MLDISKISDLIKPEKSIICDSESNISELCFDSRSISFPAQTLFFAIKTEKNDGHRYIESLIKRGVLNFIVTDPVEQFRQYGQCNFLQVRDAVEVLQKIASFHRSAFSIPVIGITGSNGKTIVKEWLSLMLADDYNVVKSPNSYNSQIGVPVSVWQMNKNHTLGIFEAGISKPGEMIKLADIIQPTIGILTNIGEAHSRYFKDNREKLTEKLKLFKNTESLIYCDNNDLIYDVLKNTEYDKLTKLSWGNRHDSFYKISNRKILKNYTVIDIDNQSFKIPFVDAASVENAVNAAVLMLFLNFPVSIINRKLALLTPVSMRMEIIEALNQSIIINDTYSLDITSLRIALDFLNSQVQLPDKCLIISDFEQVASFSDADYEDIFHLLEKNNVTKFIAVGKMFFGKQHLFKIKEQYFYSTTDELIRHIDQVNLQQSSILIKGARSFHFERIVDLLQMKTHQTILSVNLSAIINNLNYYKSLIKPSTKIVAMVKALCYGLGDVELINELSYHNIDYLAVAYTDEGVRLRKRNVTTPIIVLGAEAHSFEKMVNFGLEPEIYNFYYLKQLEITLSLHPEIKSFNIHIKIDTGMHRLGFEKQDIAELIEIVKHNSQLKIASVFSHLAAAEDAGEDSFSKYQINYFTEVSDQIRNSFSYPILRHILNSSGISRFPEAQFEMVRLGIGLYGYSPLENDKMHLQNPVTLKTLITQIKKIPAGDTIGYNRTFIAEREMDIAIIPIGYADGLPRELSNGVGEVYVNGAFAPLVGKISMDMSVIDVSGINVSVGDEVIVYGDMNPVDKVALKINRIPYELLTSISRRVPRVYVME